MKSALYLFIILCACSPKRDRIEIPEVDQNFYSQALIQINDDLKSDEDNIKLVEQKIYYCDYLNWPETCIDALDEYKRQKGMSPVLLDQYITYYRRHEDYEPLLETINRWSAELDLGDTYTKERIIASVKLKDFNLARILLRSYMIQKGTKEEVQFAAEQYLEMQDTTMSALYLSRLWKLEPTNELLFDRYAHMLMEVGYTEKAFDLFEIRSALDKSDFQFHSELSTYYEQENRLSDARKKLLDFTMQDSVVHRIADLYVAEQKWDSAHLFIDKIIDRDSANRDAWWRKARMYEDQGWLTYSMNYFDHVIYLYPNDTVAIKRADLVRRKIAYLQRLKFEENKLPLLEIESKKTIN